MRHALALALIVLSITSSGCALVEDSCRNVIVGIKTPIEEHREKARNREWAEAAWQQVCAASHGSPTEDYASGFKDGFAEYLYRGGDGLPPLVAPLRYRDSRYQNEQGYRAAQDWFAGYRHGAAMARDSGARRWIVGPSSLQAELDALHMPHAPPQVAPVELPPPTPLPNTGPEQESPAPGSPAPRLSAPEVTVPVNEEKDQLQVELVPPTDAGAALPKAWRLQIQKVTEAAREGPAPAGPPEPEVTPAPPSIEPPRPLPRLPMEPDANSVQPSSEPVHLRILKITPRISAVPPSVESPQPTRLRIVEVAPEVTAVQPAVEPAPPLPEPVRLRILEITEAGGPVIINRGLDEAKIRITGVLQDAPPVRPRITGIIATPEKD